MEDTKTWVCDRNVIQFFYQVRTGNYSTIAGNPNAPFLSAPEMPLCNGNERWKINEQFMNSPLFLKIQHEGIEKMYLRVGIFHDCEGSFML